jgi:ribosomal protein L21E
MQILTDAFQPEGITWMFQDSVFMMPHLGVLSTVHNEAALQIFDKDCLVKLGTVIAPRGIGKPGTLCMEVKIELPEGKILEEKLNFGDIKRIPLAEGVEAKVTINTQKGYTISYKEDGSGATQTIDTAMGGEVGLILDARGRPLQLETEVGARKKQLVDWFNKVRLYPNVDINKLLGVN